MALRNRPLYFIYVDVVGQSSLTGTLLAIWKCHLVAIVMVCSPFHFSQANE